MLVREYSCGREGNGLGEEGAVKGTHGAINRRPHHVMKLAHRVSPSSLGGYDGDGNYLESQKKYARSPMQDPWYAYLHVA
jgi:hypothetical protein